MTGNNICRDRLRVVILATVLAFSSAACPLVALGQSSLAGPSLDPQDRYVITTNTDGLTTNFVLFRDATERNTFHYLADVPRLAERDGKPRLDLRIHQQTSSRDPGRVMEGGLLRFAIAHQANASVLQRVRKQLAQQTAALQTNPDAIRLRPLPLVDAGAIYQPTGTDSVAQHYPLAPGVAPLLGTKRVAFLMELSQGSVGRFQEEIADGCLPIGFQLTFAGVAPATDLKLEINWDRLHDSLDVAPQERNPLADALSVKATQDDLLNLLVPLNAVTFSAAGATDRAVVASYLNLLRPVIWQAFFADPIVPSFRVNGFGGAMPTILGDPNRLLPAARRRRGRTSFSFNSPMRIRQTLRIRDSIELQKYPQPMRSALVSHVQGDMQKFASLLLPDVGPSLGVQRLSLAARLESRDGRVVAEKQTALFDAKADGRWRGPAKTFVDDLKFPLASIRRTLNPEEQRQLQYRIEMGIRRKPADEIDYPDSMESYSIPLAFPVTDIRPIEVVSVSASRLFDSSPKLRDVSVDLSAGSRRMRARFEAGKPKQLVHFLLPNVTGSQQPPLKIEATFNEGRYRKKTTKTIEGSRPYDHIELKQLYREAR
jgi:hypothetical protein